MNVLPIYHDCKKIEETSEVAGLQLKIAVLVADKYLSLYEPALTQLENDSHVHWLKNWIDILANDPLRQDLLKRQLGKFRTTTRHVDKPAQLRLGETDWDS